jgi:hypothetical protein
MDWNTTMYLLNKRDVLHALQHRPAPSAAGLDLELMHSACWQQQQQQPQRVTHLRSQWFKL